MLTPRRFELSLHLALILYLVLVASCSRPLPPSEPLDQPSHSQTPESAVTQVAIEQQVKEFCGACHPVPSPSEFPRHAWRAEVQQGYDLYFQSDRSGLRVPVFSEVLAYFEQRAPTTWSFTESSLPETTTNIKFVEQASKNSVGVHAISHLKAIDLDQAPSLLVTDMRSGEVSRKVFVGREWQTEVMGRVQSPAHIEPCDLDSNNELDFVVADLGSFKPADHDRGQVVWLRRSAIDSGYEAIVLLKDKGRIADVRPIDIDQDGDEDLLVAEFGWRRTGSIFVMINEGSRVGGGPPAFTQQFIDARHGAIQVPTLDINGDNQMDFVTILGQEHETVEVFFGNEALTFSHTHVFRANTPTFGSSGIDLTDIDQDGDTDILCTNGDMLDDFLLRSSHGIRWLENRDQHDWICHEVTSMPGVLRAISVDMDDDGDMDIVACSLIPDRAKSDSHHSKLDSLIWLEQTSDQKFVRHRIEANVTRHAAVDAGDFDRDGDIDIAVGHFAQNDGDVVPELSIWWNQMTQPIIGEDPSD